VATYNVLADAVEKRQGVLVTGNHVAFDAVQELQRYRRQADRRHREQQHGQAASSQDGAAAT
jgi:hypothetical protein